MTAAMRCCVSCLPELPFRNEECTDLMILDEVYEGQGEQTEC